MTYDTGETFVYVTAFLTGLKGNFIPSLSVVHAKCIFVTGMLLPWL